jgi:hypothetical protein
MVLVSDLVLSPLGRRSLFGLRLHVKCTRACIPPEENSRKLTPLDKQQYGLGRRHVIRPRHPRFRAEPGFSSGLNKPWKKNAAVHRSRLSRNQRIADVAATDRLCPSGVLAQRLKEL